MSDPAQQFAGDDIRRIASELANSLDYWLAKYLEDPGEGPEQDELRDLLWDGKNGILRVLQHVAALPVRDKHEMGQFEKVVPVNATIEMADAGAQQAGISISQAAAVYRAMILAWQPAGEK